MATLTTDFIKIAQAGQAFDGRTIREDWIRDMAETYDPAVYTAMLWPEHMRWFGQLGEVAELRAGPDEKGVYSLFARLKPNKRLLEWNAEGQGLFYSIEVEEDFPGCPGKTYLGGLGVTDSPASLGLASARFSSRKDAKPPHCMSNVPLVPSALDPTPLQQGDEAPGWFRRMFPSFFTSDNGAQTPEQKDSRMEELEARVTALEDSVTTQRDQIAAMEGRLAALEVDVAANGGEGAGSDPAYKALARQIGSFRKEMTEFTQKMSAAARPGTHAPANTGPAKGKSIL